MKLIMGIWTVGIWKVKSEGSYHGNSNEETDCRIFFGLSGTNTIHTENDLEQIDGETFYSTGDLGESNRPGQGINQVVSILMCLQGQKPREMVIPLQGQKEATSCMEKGRRVVFQVSLVLVIVGCGGDPYPLRLEQRIGGRCLVNWRAIPMA